MTLIQRHILGLALSSAMILGQAAFAEDVAPCWRATTATTFQDWSFNANNNPAQPEQYNNSIGTPQASFVIGTFGKGWQSSMFGNRTGGWDLGQNGTMTLAIPNPAGTTTSTKYLRVQVTYFEGIYVAPNVAISGATQLWTSNYIAQTIVGLGTWRVMEHIYRVAPEPASETVQLTATASGALIDQVVVDTINLEPSCPNDIAVNADPGTCSKAIASYGLPAIDGCVLTNATCSPAEGSSFDVGTTPVTCTVQDFMGGVTTCNFTVTVNDVEAPEISLVGASPMILECKAAYVEPGATALDGCAGTVNVTVSGTVDVNTPGDYTITYTADDGNGNIATTTRTVTVEDTGMPTIGAITATQAAVDVKDCVATIFPGTVEITVQVSDTCGAVAAPILSLQNDTTTETLVSTGENPPGSGIYHYIWTVTTATATGTWTATVTASDGANSAEANFTLCVNKAQVSGQIELESYVGATRTVTFVARNDATQESKTWVVDLPFTGGIANFVLADVPVGATRISAKTDWNLRRILPMALDPSGQATVNFTGDNMLKGGDMVTLSGEQPPQEVPPDNQVNLSDYLILKTNWYTHNPVGDITGDGNVDLDDYFIIYLNWFTAGDEW